MRSVLAVCALGASACLSTPPPADRAVDAAVDAPLGCRDLDGDGWNTGCADLAPDEVDCDDDNAARHPGAHELAGTDDHDCDGDGLLSTDVFPDLAVASFGGTGAVVTNRFHRATLDPNSGHQLGGLLVSRMVGGLSEELIYRGPLREMFSGVHVWDDFLAVDPDASALVPGDPAHPGPVVYQATVPWWAGGTDADRALDGTSLYTFTIDGRIVRTDRFTLAVQPPLMSVADFPGITGHISLAARGASSGNTNLDTLVVLDGTTVRSEALDVVAPGGGHNSLGNPNTWRWSCASGTDVEVGFVPFIPAGQPTRSLRATDNVSNAPVYRQVALQYDWQQGVGAFPDTTLTLGAQRGHFMILPHARSGASCELVGQQAAAYLTPTTLTFGNPASGELIIDHADDENGDGYVEGGGYWALHAEQPGGVQFSLVAQGGTALPPHALFRIDGVPADRDPLVYLDGARVTHGRQYRLQADGTTGVWLAILVGLAAGQVVELRYPGACPGTCAN